MSDGPRHGANFNEDDYARPFQPFRCGWADEGNACSLGPTRLGICRSAHECAPYKEGDTWTCARTKAHGGACEEGPLPDGTCCASIQRCQPVRNVLSKRGLVSLCVFALAVGAGFIMLASPSRSDVASPGDLSPQHRQVVQRCQDCHVAGDGKLSDWIHASLDGKAAEQQSQLCVNCHRDLGDHAMQPHGSSALTLASLTSAAEARDERASSQTIVSIAKSIFGSPTETHAALACATCHKEHHGDDSLTELTNNQCQTCHARAFDSFAHGHPEFANYVYKRRTRIYFDHASHYGQHFMQAGGETGSEAAKHACNSCHVPDTTGRYMLVRDFEQSCASCHQEQIEDDSLPGLAILALPALDLATLREKQIEIGYWPKSYPLHVEASGQLTPLARLLLSGSDDFPNAYFTIGKLDLSDLTSASDEELQAVGKVIMQFKTMLSEIATGGHPEVKRRLLTVFGGAVAEAQTLALANSLPIDSLMDMRDWLSEANGTEDTEASSTLPNPTEALAAERARVTGVASGWYLHPSSFSLRYRPSGHADPLLKTLLDIRAGALPHRAATPLGVAHRALRDAYRQLSSPFAVGRCTKCHSVEYFGGQNHVNWRPYTPPLDRHDFTKFSHAPHVTMLKDEACANCHELVSLSSASESLYRPEFHHSDWTPATDASVFENNFAPPLKVGCVQCHTEQTSRDSCLTCHNYHVR